MIVEISRSSLIMIMIISSYKSYQATYTLSSHILCTHTCERTHTCTPLSRFLAIAAVNFRRPKITLAMANNIIIAIALWCTSSPLGDLMIRAFCLVCLALKPQPQFLMNYCTIDCSFEFFLCRYFSEIFNESGGPANVAKYGDWFSYDRTPRANIFRRDHKKVTDVDSMTRLMRRVEVGNQCF